MSNFSDTLFFLIITLAFLLWLTVVWIAGLNKRSLIIIASGIVLWTITTQLNHYLAPLHLNLFTSGLILAYPALRLPPRDIWRIALPLGLWADASTAVTFGAHAILFLLACAIIQRARGRIPKTDTIVGAAIAIASNTAIIAALSLALAIRGPVPQGIAWTLGCNALFSALFIAIAARWYFALQTRTLHLAGIDERTLAGQADQN